MVSEETPLVGPAQLDPSPNSAINKNHDTVYKDNPKHMTRGRRMARFLSKFSWYNPHVESTYSSKPSLDEAWAYFEHIVLARHLVPDDDDDAKERNKDLRRRAERGERDRPTRLYPVLTIPESDLADFGVGVGVYFFTLRSLCIIMLLAGLINLPLLHYYGSDAYNAAHEAIHFRSLKTSAICTDNTWVACPTCTRQQWDRFPATYDRYASTNNGLAFILRRNCQVNDKMAFVAWLSLLFVCVSIYVLQKITKRRERVLDEARQTATDYAVEVVNPPKDAREGAEWRNFFEQFGHVTCCTVTLDNEELIAALVSRRELLNQLANLQPAGVVMDRNDIEGAVATANAVPWYFQCMGSASAETIQDKLAKLDELILTDLATRDYDVSNIFVIFETEQHQQEALKQLAVLGIDKMRNNTSALPEHLLFRGQYVLAVNEPPEPSSVRWMDLDEGFTAQLSQRLVTFVLTILVIIGGCFTVTYMRYRFGIVYAALTVSAINSIAPAICKAITAYESHSSEGSMQSSLYFKITATLWINTAIITAFVTPFVNTLDDEKEALIPSMLAIFITELGKNPVVQLLDIGGNAKRHILGPRAVEQRQMNMYFQGTEWSLSERYTDMTNILFLTFYYALLFPAGFFFAAATLAVHYWTDKYCLLRTWAPSPNLGIAIADMSRIYFFSSAIAVYSVVSSYNFASFPYDNACEDETEVASDYVGSFDAVSGSGTLISVDIAKGDRNYFYCNQDMLHYHPPAFPAIPSNQPFGAHWMSEAQRFSVIFGWTSVIIVAFVVGIFLNAIRKWLAPQFFRIYKRHAYTPERPSKNFSEVLDIFAYVPQVQVAGDPFPVLLCDTSTIDEELIGWQDPADCGYKEHNAIYDLPGLSESNVFSVIQHWPPSSMN